MTSAIIKILKNGKLITTVERPVHQIDGNRMIKYKRKLWILHNGNSVHTEHGPYLDNPIQEDQSTDNVQSITKREEEQTLEEEPVLAPITWTTLQKKIIESNCQKRLLISACPGTGKTATLCAKVAWLVDRVQIPPSNIIIVSFSRTAVKEIRNRIQTYLINPNFVSSIPIATIDSYAWMIHTGFSTHESNSPLDKIGYEENVLQLTNKIRNDPLLQEYFSSLSHVLIDEAQDIIGVRTELIQTILDHLNPECGITVLGDEAQSIYGFSEESSNTNSAYTESLISKVRKSNKFEEIELLEIHRTSSPKLKILFTDVRSDVLKLTNSNADGPRQIADAVRNASTGDAVKLNSPEELRGANNAFVLYRSRAEALQASSYFSAHQVPHRLRISGLPPCIYPWVGAIFGDHSETQISQSDFDFLWTKFCISELINCGFNSSQAWENLKQIDSSRNQIIKLSQIRKVLGRPQPPLQFCFPDFGVYGPAIGTIHASKGREADNVHLFIPQYLNDQKNICEEARILFVGGTRAKKALHVGNGNRIFSINIGVKNRVVSKLSGIHRGQVQIGCSGDITAVSVAGKEYFNEAEVKNMQHRFIDNNSVLPLSLTAKRVPEADYAYILINDENEEFFGWLDKRSFNHDLWKAGEYILDGQKIISLPSYFNHVWLHGFRTIVLSPDSIECQSLHEPWASSGFMLAPMISAFTNAYFQRGKV